jgi:hypothetical protein
MANIMNITESNLYESKHVQVGDWSVNTLFTR